MAFAINNLIPIGGQSAKGVAGSMWSYSSADALAVVDGAGYFDGASTLLAIGDLIYVQVRATPDVVPTDAGHVIVLSNAAGVVDTSNESALVVVDSD